MRHFGHSIMWHWCRKERLWLSRPCRHAKCDGPAAYSAIRPTAPPQPERD